MIPSGDVRDFILQHIDSIVQLEALLLLRTNSDKRWTVDDIARRLHASQPAAAEALTRLAADGFCDRSDAFYRYRRSNEEQEVTIGRLSEVYAHHLIPVTNFVHDKSAHIQKARDATKSLKGI